MNYTLNGKVDWELYALRVGFTVSLLALTLFVVFVFTPETFELFSFYMLVFWVFLVVVFWFLACGVIVIVGFFRSLWNHLHED
jgi:preprotein translocase subunit SecF